MKVDFWYLDKENVALLMDNTMFTFGSSDTCNIETDTRPKIVKLPLKNQKTTDFKHTQNLHNAFELTQYKISTSGYSVMIKREKYRFFYCNYEFLHTVGNRIKTVLDDLKRFFPRRIDIAMLPITKNSNDQILYLLNSIKPRYFAPLLPDRDPNLVENFLKSYKPGNTAVLIYTQPCELFEFNLL